MLYSQNKGQPWWKIQTPSLGGALALRPLWHASQKEGSNLARVANALAISSQYVCKAQHLVHQFWIAPGQFNNAADSASLAMRTSGLQQLYCIFDWNLLHKRVKKDKGWQRSMYLSTCPLLWRSSHLEKKGKGAVPHHVCRTPEQPSLRRSTIKMFKPTVHLDVHLLWLVCESCNHIIIKYYRYR